jgi:Flp pilus assembly CpaE family ATPase
MTFDLPRLRVALGLGDQELEQRLRPALDGFDDTMVVAQCLAADQLLDVVESGQVDALVVSSHLYRLTDAILAQLERRGLPLVLLASDPLDERWSARRDPTLGHDADAALIRQALTAARRGQRVPVARRPSAERLPLKDADKPAAPSARILAVTGGFGSPGRTSVGINLAAALGAVAPTVLVELDLCATAAVAYLDRDPSRNICTLAHAVREDPRAWSMALQAELQPLSHGGGGAEVLCGLPKREMRSSIVPHFVDRLIAELAARYRWVVLDVGPELLGTEPAANNHRAALSRADQVLLVIAADLVGLYHGRTALDQLERQVSLTRQQVAVVLNRFDARHHHPRSEVEWHLGARVAGVVPFDQRAVQGAIMAQQPIVHQPATRASRALLELAGELYEGKIQAPVRSAPGSNTTPWWRKLVPGKAAQRPTTRQSARVAASTAGRGSRGGPWS